ncbi:hypothetical protein F5Y12DRAFT_717353 [Xylaria sp. FL1777]|nr:hypothetical protein F5Y12DRAFT_717353 [Xylaria sp. FL1777]
MTFILSVVYPAGAKFDMDYYLKTHMPLVQKVWENHGLKSWKIAQYDNANAPYIVQAWLEWESKEHSEAGAKSEDGKAVFADIPNFCDKSPVVLSGPKMASASW